MRNVRIGTRRVLLTDSEIEALNQFRATEAAVLTKAIADDEIENLSEALHAFDLAGECFLETISGDL